MYVFDPIWMPTCLHFPSQNPTEMLPKSILKGIDFLIDFGNEFLSILVRFWSPTWRQKGAPGKGDWSLNSPWGRSRHLPRRAWQPEFAQTTKLDPKPFLDRFWHRFFIDFGSIWGPILRPCWPLFRAQNGPPSRYSPLCLHVGSMLSLLAPFLTFPAPSWRHFGTILEGLRAPFARFWVPFCLQFLSFCKGVGGMGEAFLDLISVYN